MHSEFALPLMLEAVLLLGFGALGEQLARIDGLFVPLTVMLLSFIMGLQNALITKLSRAEIRTTHVTGLVTDLGIELGKLAYWNSPCAADAPRVRADRARLKILGLLAVCFFMGGVFGALGFKQLGYAATVPLALALTVLASVPALDDLGRLVLKLRKLRRPWKSAERPRANRRWGRPSDRSSSCTSGSHLMPLS